MADSDIAFIGTVSLGVGGSFWSLRGKNFGSAEITVYRDRIIIADKWPRRVFEFPKSDVVAIRRGRFFWNSFRIVHKAADQPAYIQIGLGGAGDLFAEMSRQVGYNVEETDLVKL